MSCNQCHNKVKKKKKEKKKFFPLHDMKPEEGSRIISSLILTSALDWREWLTWRPGRFNPGKESRYPLNRRLCEPQRRSVRFKEGENASPLPGLEPRIVHYTDHTILAPLVLEQERWYTYKRILKTRSRNHSCRREAKNITYSECLSVALFMQHTMRMRRIILSSVAWLALPYFSTLSQKGTFFLKKGYCTLNVCRHFLYSFCLKHFPF